MNIAGKKIHFMGVGGIGMSALAGMALDRGAIVSGCDRAENDQTDMLKKLGAQISIGHSEVHSENCDKLVYTSAVSIEHPELVAAGEKSIKRGMFLAEIMAGYKGVGVAGTHGKTSTTWMAAHILIKNGIDPTVLLGGVTDEMNGNYRCGGEVFISELDESDGSFLEPELDVAVITNIESEHLAYYGTSEKVVEAFGIFAEKINTGLLIVGYDNEHCAQIFANHQGRKKAFGINSSGIGLCAEKLSYINGMQVADLTYAGTKVGQLKIPLCGKHNVLNSLAALLIGEEFGVSLEDGLRSLETIKTVGRRMELIHTLDTSKIYSDYAHHPTEVKAALQGARELDASGKIMVIFQPHLYTRTRDYAKDFARELVKADFVVVAEIYPAREKPIAGVSSELIRERLRIIGGNVDNSKVKVDQINNFIFKYAPEYSTIICIGAGDIDIEVRKIAVNKLG